MNASRRITLRRIVGVLLLLSMSSMGVSAQVRGETQIQSASQANWRALRVLITRIEDRADLLRSGLSVSTGRNSVYGSRVEDNASGLLGNFSGAVQRLHQRLNQRQATADDAQEVLDGATALDRYIRRHPVNAQTQRYWSNLRVDLNQLARVYGLSWSTTTGGYRNYPNGEYGNYPTTPSYPTRPAYVTGQLTGTYRLDSSRSDDPRNTIDSALRSLPYEERQ